MQIFFKDSHKKCNSHIRNSMLYFLNVINLGICLLHLRSLYFYIFTFEINTLEFPVKIAVWVELILIHLLVPQSSFIGHLGGILVGCLYCYTFIGEIVDNMIYAITGTPIIHEEQFL